MAESSVRELLLQTYDSVLPPRSAIYCSAPLTSGRRYIDWVKERGGKRHAIDDLTGQGRDLHRTQVIEPNRAHAREIVAQLRQRMAEPVINPTAIGAVNGWRQSDWISFWEEVIGRYASKVVFLEGWEYSHGCTHEFWFARRQRITTLNESQMPLSAQAGAERIRSALPVLAEAGADIAKFQRILESLSSLKP